MRQEIILQYRRLQNYSKDKKRFKKTEFYLFQYCLKMSQHQAQCCAPMYDEVVIAQPYVIAHPSNYECAPMYDEVEAVSTQPPAKTEGAMPHNPLFHTDVLDSTEEEQEIRRSKHHYWNDSNIEVVRKWKKNLKHSSIAFSHLLDSNSSNLQRVLLISLIASACLSALQVLIVTLGAVQVNTWIIFGFNVFALLGSGFILIVSGLNQVYGWDGKVTDLTRIVEQLDSLWLTLDTEMNLPVSHRFNGNDFVRRVTGQYDIIMKQCKHLKEADYVRAIREHSRLQDQLHEIRVE